MASSPSVPGLLAGTASIAIDGKSFLMQGAGSYRVSSATGNRETLMGQDGYHGWKGSPNAGKIGWTGRDRSGQLISALNDAANVTVVLALANGKTIIGRNMIRVGEPIEVDTDEATYTIVFEGPDVTEN